MQHRGKPSFLRQLAHGTLVVVGAVVMTCAFFLVLPMIQAITKAAQPDTLLQSLDAGIVDPPPPVVEEEEEPEPEPEDTPPELSEEPPLLDLAQLDVALGPSIGEGFLGGDFALKLTGAVAGGGSVDELFDLQDFDQKPRVVHQPSPSMTPDMVKRAPATVYVEFIVDERGRVQKPKVKDTGDPMFDRAAVAAVKQWRFDPAKRSGKAVEYPMRVPITFPRKK